MQSVINFFKKPLLKLPLFFGVIAGVVCFLFFLLVQSLEKFSSTSRALDVGFFAIIITGATWYYRKKVGKGYLHMWEGISIGYVVWITGALVCGYLSSLYFYFFPKALAHYQEMLRQSLLVNKAEAIKVWGNESFQQKLSDIDKLVPLSFIFDEFRFTLMLVVMPILLIALMLRKQNPNSLSR